MSPPDGNAVAPMMRQADQKHCFSCGKLLHITASACPSCGAHQTQAAAGQLTAQPVLGAGYAAARPVPAGLPSGQSKFCFGCGTQIHQAAYACPACGARQQGGQAHVARKDRTVAIVLAFLLGGVGAHRFYLGDVWLGLLYLVFCWTFIPALIATVEGIIFISTSDIDFQRKYGALR